MRWFAGAYKKIEEEILAWPNVVGRDHRFGGREFLFGKAEIGHVHWGRTVDIPFPRSIHDALIADGLAQQHRWAPDSGWITFHIRAQEDVRHALWLMRLSYLRYALKSTHHARDLLERENQSMPLNRTYRDILENFLPLVERTRHFTSRV